MVLKIVQNAEKFPVKFGKKTRNPKFSDEEFAKNIKERIEMVKIL